MPTGGESKSGQPKSAFSEGVAFLDTALWSRLQKAESREDFAAAWLALQCAFIGNVKTAVMVLRAEHGPELEPVAYWPVGAPATVGLSTAAEAAIQERRGVIRASQGQAGGEDKASSFDVAYPIVLDDEPAGVLAIEVKERSREELTTIVRQLQWGAGWVESWLSKSDLRRERATHERIDVSLDIIGELIAATTFKEASTALATALSSKLDFDRVGVGYRGDKDHTKIAGVSHSAQFDDRLSLLNSLGHLMDEALDQWTFIHHPSASESLVVRAHEAHAKQFGCTSVLTVPLTIGDAFLGAITLERCSGEAIEPETVDFICALATIVAPLLEDKRVASLSGPRRLLLKVQRGWAQLLSDAKPMNRLRLALVAVLVLFFAFAKGDYLVTADARLDADQRRILAAPYEGFIGEAMVRAGDTVAKGDVVARMNTEELALEEIRWITELDRLKVEHQQALALSERARINIASAQIEQAKAQLALVQEHLARSDIKAPYDGVVILGDLTSMIDGAVRQGDVLFEVAPLTGYRVMLQVDERDIRPVDVGQSGRLVISSLPGETFDFTVTRLTPVSVSMDGSTGFEVEASLDAASDLTRLRPGMTGIGKIDVDRRRLIWIWTHRFTDWVRLKLWRWVG